MVPNVIGHKGSGHVAITVILEDFDERRREKACWTEDRLGDFPANAKSLLAKTSLTRLNQKTAGHLIDPAIAREMNSSYGSRI
jgi:hypothetical protein